LCDFKEPHTFPREQFGDLQTGGQVIRNVKYADDLVLLTKDEKVLQGISENRQYY
jgi:hypothetical protein